MEGTSPPLISNTITLPAPPSTDPGHISSTHCDPTKQSSNHGGLKWNPTTQKEHRWTCRPCGKFREVSCMEPCQPSSRPLNVQRSKNRFMASLLRDSHFSNTTFWLSRNHGTIPAHGPPTTLCDNPTTSTTYKPTPYTTTLSPRYTTLFTSLFHGENQAYSPILLAMFLDIDIRLNANTKADKEEGVYIRVYNISSPPELGPRRQLPESSGLALMAKALLDQGRFYIDFADKRLNNHQNHPSGKL